MVFLAIGVHLLDDSVDRVLLGLLGVVPGSSHDSIVRITASARGASATSRRCDVCVDFVECGNIAAITLCCGQAVLPGRSDFRVQHTAVFRVPSNQLIIQSVPVALDVVDCHIIQLLIAADSLFEGSNLCILLFLIRRFHVVQGLFLCIDGIIRLVIGKFLLELGHLFLQLDFLCLRITAVVQ